MVPDVWETMRTASKRANKCKDPQVVGVCVRGWGWGGVGGLLTGLRRSVKGLSGSWGVFTSVVDWWPWWVVAASGHWNGLISLAWHWIAPLFSSMIFCSVVYFHKPIKDQSVTAYCQQSPSIVWWITAPVQTGFTVQADIVTQWEQKDEVISSDHQNIFCTAITQTTHTHYSPVKWI